MLKESWDAGIQKAKYLAARNDGSSKLLSVYGRLMRVMVSAVLHSVERCGLPPLARAAQFPSWLDEEESDQMLLEQWQRPSDLEFFAKAVLQPYARWLAESDTRPRVNFAGKKLLVFNVPNRIAFGPTSAPRPSLLSSSRKVSRRDKRIVNPKL